MVSPETVQGQDQAGFRARSFHGLCSDAVFCRPEQQYHVAGRGIHAAPDSAGSL